MQAALDDLGTQRDAGLDRNRLDVEQVAARIDEALAEQETEREILEVGRRGEHHGMRDAVDLERHRHFLGDAFVDRRPDAIAPGRGQDGR